MKYFLFIALAFTSFATYAEKYRVISGETITEYDSDTCTTSRQDFGDEAREQIRITSVVRISGMTISAFSSGDLERQAEIILAAQMQRALIAQFQEQYGELDLMAALQRQETLTNRLLVLVAKVGSTPIDSTQFSHVMDFFGNKAIAAALLFQDTRFVSPDESLKSVDAVLAGQHAWSDCTWVELLRTIATKQPDIGTGREMAFFDRVRNDTYRIDCLKLFATSKMNGTERMSLLQRVGSDTYKVDAIKVYTRHLGLNTVSFAELKNWLGSVSADTYKVDVIKLISAKPLSATEAIELINDVNSDTYRVDAIKALRSQLSHISTDQYFAIIQGLSPSYQGDAIRVLPQPKTAPVATPVAITPVAQSAAASIIPTLRAMSWDDGRLDMLRRIPQRNLSAQQLKDILRCFKWDDGKNGALRIILSQLSSGSKAAITASATNIVSVFQWDDGRTEAMGTLFGR